MYSTKNTNNPKIIAKSKQKLPQKYNIYISKTE